ncbi:uncharacterized protein METZ01_LOCUS423171 [marine metagenome]|uniref:Uncharacterized protein n=1 Tax=marine metagenome TaxID=408172 RepID=A0A382XGN1_9ZZZZ
MMTARLFNVAKSYMYSANLMSIA